jgi:hypothetical protein
MIVISIPFIFRETGYPGKNSTQNSHATKRFCSQRVTIISEQSVNILALSELIH